MTSNKPDENQSLKKDDPAVLSESVVTDDCLSESSCDEDQDNKSGNDLSFLTKLQRPIPSLKQIKFFLQKQALRYLPCDKEFTHNFAKDVISGKKKLLAIQDVRSINHFSIYQTLPHKLIWKEVRYETQLNQYFPEYPRGTVPDKAYMLNVINTVDPEVIQTALRFVRLKELKSL